MADLISRAALIEEFMGKPPDFYHTSYIVGEINCLPSVDAVPVVHGRWGENGDCSECGFQPWYERDIHTLSYCPNCGAEIAAQLWNTRVETDPEENAGGE